MTGELKPGEKLPIEPDLSTQYGVSRSTVREALRVLASKNLIATTRGVSGGSFVAYPNPEQISGYLEASLRLLAQADNLTIAQLAEARDLLEVPTAGLAAVRRSDRQLEDLRLTLGDGAGAGAGAVERTKAFHSTLVRAAGSPLVEVLIRPVFEVIYDHVGRWDAPVDFWATLGHDHDRIFAAVAARDAVTAQAETRDHLRKLQPAYSQP